MHIVYPYAISHSHTQKSAIRLQHLLFSSFPLFFAMFHKRLFHSSRAVLYNTLTPLTHIKHSHLQRNPKFAKVQSDNFLCNTELTHSWYQITDKDIEYFKGILSPNNILYDPDPESLELRQHNTDWFNLYRGSAS